MPAPNLQDKLLEQFGKPGKFQVILFILLCTNAYPITFNFLFITFFTNVPPFLCKSNDYNDSKPIPELDKDRCKVFLNPENHSAGYNSCTTGYRYAKDGYDWTIASEWNLVCDKAELAPLAATIFFTGVMIGGLVIGTLADKFGRKPIVLLTLYGQAILGIAIAFSPNYIMFVVLKFFQGALIQGLQSSNNSLVMELFPLRYRTIAGMIYASCATSGHMMMAAFLYLMPQWYNMQFFISCLTGITIFYSWLYPESVRWLLTQKQHDKAYNLLERFSKINKIEMPQNVKQELQDISKEIESKAKNTPKYDLRDLFRTRNMRKYSFFLLFSWFSAAVTYYGIQFYIPKMPGKQYRYLNLFISGAMETAARIVGYFIIDRIGRRKPLLISFALSGVLCIVTGFVDHFFKLTTLSNILAILGKLCSAQCFAFNLIYSSEIFPTVIRTVGLGAVACFARIGVMVAPQILSLQTVVSLWLPFVIFGIVSIVSAGLIFMLPETRNKPLPTTIEDLEEMSESQVKSEAENHPRVEYQPKVEDQLNISAQPKDEINGIDNPNLDDTDIPKNETLSEKKNNIPVSNHEESERL